MKRIAISERPDWRAKASEFGFQFHTMHGEPYWCEDAYYQFSMAQVEALEETTAELHQMCLQAVEKVVDSEALLSRFQIPKHTWDFVRASWRSGQPSLYSRLDLAYDGQGRPSCWRITPIRQPRCMSPRFSSGFGWKIRCGPVSCPR